MVHLEGTGRADVASFSRALGLLEWPGALAPSRRVSLTCEASRPDTDFSAAVKVLDVISFPHKAVSSALKMCGLVQHHRETWAGPRAPLRCLPRLWLPHLRSCVVETAFLLDLRDSLCWLQSPSAAPSPPSASMELESWGLALGEALAEGLWRLVWSSAHTPQTFSISAVSVLGFVTIRVFAFNFLQVLFLCIHN